MPPAPADNGGVRTVKLGNAGGSPATGTPQDAPVMFSRVEIAKMQLERPEEYQARQAEIIRAYQEGRVR